MMSLTLLLLGIASGATAQSPANPGTLAFTTPPGWKVRAPSSSMRIAEFVLPGQDGASEPAELVVYYFGGTGGSVEANVQRWISQFAQTDGRASSEVARREARTINALKVALVDVSGTYTAEVRPGATEHFNKPGFRMRAAVVDTPKGPYFVKLVGPASTVTRWDGAFAAFLDSIRFEK